MNDLDRIEEKRLALQAMLDDGKTSEDRNRMGQFATPTLLAREILAHGVRLLPPETPIKFTDPGIGTGSFYSALRKAVPEKQIERAAGFEVDSYYGKPARELWTGTPLKIHLDDFTKAEPGELGKANLLICNPPYVRHHHIDAETKTSLQRRTEEACGVKINGLSGLYCYFMGLAHKWMEPGAISGWLIPSEFMGVNYGRQLKQYLLNKVTLLQIHRFDPADVQFTDALVSSAVVWFKNALPPKNHTVTFSYGGTLAAPTLSRNVAASELANEQKWTRYPQADKASPRPQITLGDLFDIKRGIATGDNKFFIMTREQIKAHGLPISCFSPVLPGSRHIPDDEIHADKNGLPRIEKQLFLLDTRLPEEEITRRYPALKAYLDTGNNGDKPVSGRYLCRSRRLWYAQENRPAAPIISTYMGRGRNGAKPFRFILNHSQATACNVYLMFYPKPMFARAFERNPELLRTVWEFLNEIETDELLEHGRVYGGGLHKLEPKELRGVSAEALIVKMPEIVPHHHQPSLFDEAAA